MIDAELIQQCADPRLGVEIVQAFIAEMNAPDHLAVFVSQGDRVILVPRPTNIEAALATTRAWFGQAIVRVGLTQYPAGLGLEDASALGLDLFDTCENLRMGTSLFGKVLRVVAERTGQDQTAVFDEAIASYLTGWFAEEQIFYAQDPGDGGFDEPSDPGQIQNAQSSAPDGDGFVGVGLTDGDPNAASIRVDLSGIEGFNQEISSED